MAQNPTVFKYWPLWDRESNPELWDHYALHTMEPGWAGELSPAQTDYIRGVLIGTVKNPFYRRIPNLRRKWGFEARDEEVTNAAILEVALNGDPDDPSLNVSLVRKANRTPVKKPRQLTLWNSLL